MSTGLLTSVSKNSSDYREAAKAFLLKDSRNSKSILKHIAVRNEPTPAFVRMGVEGCTNLLMLTDLPNEFFWTVWNFVDSVIGSSIFPVKIGKSRKPASPLFSILLWTPFDPRRS